MKRILLIIILAIMLLIFAKIAYDRHQQKLWDDFVAWHTLYEDPEWEKDSYEN